MYSHGVPWHEHLKSFKTTDPSWCYSKQKKLQIQNNFKFFEDLNYSDLRVFGLSYDGNNFIGMQSLIPLLFETTDATKLFQETLSQKGIGGILRIHVEWTHPQNCRKLECFVEKDTVSIWITMHNLKLLLPNDIVELLEAFLAKDVFQGRASKKKKNH